MKHLTLREIIPATARKYVYSVLGAFLGLNAIFGFVGNDELKQLIDAAAVLGFAVAVGNVTT